ncbi:unnamed protein product, partial [Polarella glacialis]
MGAAPRRVLLAVLASFSVSSLSSGASLSAGCREAFAEVISEVWLASGPPLVAESPGELLCTNGALFKVVCSAAGREPLETHLASVVILAVQAAVSTEAELSSIHDMLAFRADAILTDGFQLCVPFACPSPTGVMAAAAMLLSLGSGILPGSQLQVLARSFLKSPGPAEEMLDKSFVLGAAQLQTVLLNSGHRMPLVTFGTAGLEEQTADVILEALRAGHRALDTATEPADGEGFGYNQPAVGEALSRSSLPRSDVFIISKVHPADFGYLKTRRAVERAVSELGEGGQGYIDLMLLHFPTCDREYCPPGGSMRPLGSFVDAWRGLEEAVKQGLLRSIGVTNFDAQQLEELIAAAKILPAVAGVWADAFHPVPRALQKLCRTTAVQLQVFGILGFEWSQGRGRKGKLAHPTSPVLEHRDVRAIARSTGLSAPDVCAKFFLQQGMAIIISSRRPERVRRALAGAADARSLDDADMATLQDLQGFLDSSLHIQASPDFYRGMIGFDTYELHAVSQVSTNWYCEGVRATYFKDGVVHLRNFIPSVAIESARRAAQRLVSDNGGGDMEDA